MNIELTKNNLKSLCRVCLGEGKLNVCEHKISVPWTQEADHEENIGSARSSSTSFVKEITVHEMLNIFGKWEHKILDLDVEMQLICHSCINECLSCYNFYTKLELANRQVKQLYNAALEIECNQDSDQDGEITTKITAAVATKDLKATIVDFNTYSDEDNADAAFYDDVAEVHCDYEEQDREFTDHTQIPAVKTARLEPITRRPIKYTNFVPSDGVTRLLDNINETVPALSTLSSASLKREHSDDIGARHLQKRTRKKTQWERSPESRAAAHRDASLIVGHFIPSLQDKKALSSTDAAHDMLLTIDYEPVAIKGANMYQIGAADFSYSLPAMSESCSATAEPVYKCKYCPQAFAASPYLIAHVRKSHVCLFCTRAFTNQSELHEHTREAHRQHKCAICAKVLSNHSSLRGHIRRIHGIHLPAQVALLDYRLTESNMDGPGDVQELPCELVGDTEGAVPMQDVEALTFSTDGNYLQLVDNDVDDGNTYMLRFNCA